MEIDILFSFIFQFLPLNADKNVKLKRLFVSISILRYNGKITEKNKLIITSLHLV